MPVNRRKIMLMLSTIVATVLGRAVAGKDGGINTQAVPEKELSLTRPIRTLLNNLSDSTGSRLLGHRKRSVFASLSDIVNIQDFGAKVNDEDSTEAIQKAIDYAEANNRSEVYIPAGIYNISASLIVGDKLTIRGAGWRSSIIKVKSNQKLDAVIVSRAWIENGTKTNNSMTLIDFGINGNVENNTSCHGIINMHSHSNFERLSIDSVSGRGIFTTALQKNGKNVAGSNGKILAPYIRRVRIKASGMACVYAYRSTDGWIRDCITSDNGTEHQIFLEGGCAGYRIESNHINNGIGSGIVTEFGSSVSIANNIIDLIVKKPSDSEEACIKCLSILADSGFVINGNNLRVRSNSKKVSNYHGIICSSGKLGKGAVVITTNTFDGGGIAGAFVSFMGDSISGLVSSNYVRNIRKGLINSERNFKGVIGTNSKD